MPTFTKLRTYANSTGAADCSAARSVPDGTLSSSTMMVMMMATTPSVKASSRPFCMIEVLGCRNGRETGCFRRLAAQRRIRFHSTCHHSAKAWALLSLLHSEGDARDLGTPAWCDGAIA